MSSGLFAASISSLASDRGEDDDFLREESFSVYEDLTQSFLKGHPSISGGGVTSSAALHGNHFDAHSMHDPCVVPRDKPSFFNVEAGSSGVNLTFDLQHVEQDDVLVISVLCLPTYVIEEDFVACIEKRRTPGLDFSPLHFRLVNCGLDPPLGARATSLPIRPSLFNGEYCLSLTSASGLRSGTCMLNIASTDDESDDDILPQSPSERPMRNQGIRVHWQLLPSVQATSLSAGKASHGFVAANEIAYFRFVLTSPHQMVTFRARPDPREHSGNSSELELFVTDRNDGLVAVTKENSVWSSADPHGPLVQICPDDPHFFTGEGSQPVDVRYFIVGVCGVQEANTFELMASVEDFPSSVTIRTGMRAGLQHHTAQLTGNAYSHFALNIDPSRGDLVAVTWRIDEPGHTHERSKFHSLPQLLARFNICDESADGVYVSECVSPFCKETAWEEEQLQKCVVIIYLSATNRFPSHLNYSWKAFGTREAAFVVDCAAWRYLSSQCYFSVFVAPSAGLRSSRLWDDFLLEGVDPTALGLGLGLGSRPGSQDLCRALAETSSEYSASYTVWEVSKEDAGGAREDSAEWKLRQRIFAEMFRSINGAHLSHKDRDHLQATDFLNVHWLDETSLAYGEVTSVWNFATFLQSCGAIDGHVFYDLGAGCGRALAAAALSGICFLKCVGIEVLPQLAAAGSESLQWLSAQQDERFEESLMSSAQKLAQLRDEILVDEDLSSEPAKLRYQLQTARIAVPILEMRVENFLEADWFDGDIVFAASTCFSNAVVDKMFSLAERMRKGAKLVTARLPDCGLNSGLWTLERSLSCEMSWGKTEFAVLVRR